MTVHVDHQDPALKTADSPRMANSLLSRTQIEAVEFLERCVRSGEPLAALTGSAGSGKTMVLNTALAHRGSAGDRIIRVNNFVAGPLSLHRVLATALGVGEAAELSAEALEPALRRALSEASKVAPPVLAVDDAQSLLPETLRYLSLLAGLRDNGRPLLRILLVGRPGFTVRQAMPVQFTLETMRGDDAREVAAKRLAAAGVILAGGAVQEIVQRAQGNWRKLDALLRTEIDNPERAQAEAGGRQKAGLQKAGAQKAGTTSPSSLPPERTAMAAVSDGQARVSRPGSSAAWMIVLPGLLLAFASGAIIAYQEGLIGSRDAPSHVPSHVPNRPPSRAPDHAPGNAIGHAAAPAPAVPKPATAKTVTAAPAPATPAPATPTPAAPTPATHPVLLAAPPAAPPQSSPVIAAPADHTPATPQASSRPSPVPNRPAAPQATTMPPRAAAPGGLIGQFRVNNVSSCHHGVCPRWAVFDLNRNAGTLAAFDPSGLHLDPQTLQRLREGSIDLTVSGTLTKGGPDGRRLHADHLDAITAHHSHRSAMDVAPNMPAPTTPPPLMPAPVMPAPVTPAPAPTTQSPQPSFLAFPPGTPASERQPSGAAREDERASQDGPLQLAPPPLPPAH
ncbi:AAA family ATPase [Lichenicoccus sp.]|uniref:AAA family ATPase n=1 Tax=Lichenicoccus sp. TaxID=2781899 RepID=UPI003D0E968F